MYNIKTRDLLLAIWGAIAGGILSGVFLAGIINVIESGYNIFIK